MTTTESTPASVLPLGRMGITLDAGDALALAGIDPFDLLLRHANGDWGSVDADDWEANDAALREGERILSAYPLNPAAPRHGTVWIITEADRSQTLILLPRAY